MSTEIYCRFTINRLSYHTTGWLLLDYYGRFKPTAGPCSAPNHSTGLTERIKMDNAHYFRHYFDRTCRMSVVFDFRLKWRKILTWWVRGKETGAKWWRPVPSYPPVSTVSTLRQEVTQNGVIRVLQWEMPKTIVLMLTGTHSC